MNNELEPWRNRGLRDPLEILIAAEQGKAKKDKGCFICARRSVPLGGDGSCKNNYMRYKCGFRL